MSNPNRPEDRNRPDSSTRGSAGPSDSDSSQSAGGAPNAATNTDTRQTSGSTSPQSPSSSDEKSPSPAGGQSGRPEGTTSATGSSGGGDSKSGGDDKTKSSDKDAKKGGDDKGGSGGSGGSGSSTPEPRSRFTLWFVILILAGGTAVLGVFGYQMQEELREAQRKVDELSTEQADREARVEETLAEVEEQAAIAADLEAHVDDFEDFSATLADLEALGDDTATDLEELRGRVEDWEGQLDDLRQDFAARSALEDLQEDLEGRLADLEARLDDRVEELTAAQDSFDERLDGLGARSAEEEEGWLKAEAGYLSQIAIHRVRHHRDVDSALAALRGADSLLAELGGEGIPQRQAVREAIDALLDYSGPDIRGIRERISSQLAGIGNLPIRGELAEGDAPDLPEIDEADEGWQQAFTRAWSRLREGLGELVRVQREDEFEELLPPEQQYFIRESLRLQLETALMALSSGDQDGYRSSLERAIDWLERRFDTDSAEVEDALQELKDLADEPIEHDLPDIEPLLEPVKPF